MYVIKRYDKINGKLLLLNNNLKKIMTTDYNLI